MKIQLLSDLHLENNPDFTPVPAPGADLLVLAGDIGSYQRLRGGAVMPEPDWGLGRFARWPVPVLFVPGNHEYDALDVDRAHGDLQQACARHGIRWLESTVWVWRGVRFIGSTLWSDYDATCPDPRERLAHREKAFRAANHYLARMGSTVSGQPFDAAAMRERGLQSQAWLRAALAQPHDGATVVVTHFAPTLHSADPRYGLSPGTAGFCNALDDLLPQADLWLHGHMHCPTDVQVGRCRIRANPLGYANKGEQDAFDPQLLVTIASTSG